MNEKIDIMGHIKTTSPDIYQDLLYLNWTG
jgi:hypothetical protein